MKPEQRRPDPPVLRTIDSHIKRRFSCAISSIWPARSFCVSRLVDECRDDSAARHRCPGDGDLATRQARCTAASLGSRQPIHQRAVPEADGWSRRHLLDEPLGQRIERLMRLQALKARPRRHKQSTEPVHRGLIGEMKTTIQKRILPALFESDKGCQTGLLSRFAHRWPLGDVVVEMRGPRRPRLKIRGRWTAVPTISAGSSVASRTGARRHVFDSGRCTIDFTLQALPFRLQECLRLLKLGG